MFLYASDDRVKCIIYLKHRSMKSQKRRIKALFTQSSVSAGRISVQFFELSDEIIDGMKSAVVADLLQGQGGFIQESAGGLKPVADQRIDRRAVHVGLEAPPRFASADVDGACDVLESDGIRIMLVDVGQHFLDADLRRQLDAGFFRSGQGLKIAADVFKNPADIPLNGHFKAYILLTECGIDFADQP